MILDAIIGLFASLFGFIAGGVVIVFAPLINLIAAGIEAVAGLVVSGFKLGRVERKKRESKSITSAIGGVLTLMLIVAVIGWFLIGPKLMNRNVTLMQKTGMACHLRR